MGHLIGPVRIYAAGSQRPRPPSARSSDGRAAGSSAAKLLRRLWLACERGSSPRRRVAPRCRAPRTSGLTAADGVGPWSVKRRNPSKNRFFHRVVRTAPPAVSPGARKGRMVQASRSSPPVTQANGDRRVSHRVRPGDGPVMSADHDLPAAAGVRRILAVARGGHYPGGRPSPARLLGRRGWRTSRAAPSRKLRMDAA